MGQRWSASHLALFGRRLMRGEGLARLGAGRDHLEGVEADRLGQRPALADNHGVALGAPEARGDVRGNVGVALLVPAGNAKEGGWRI